MKKGIIPIMLGVFGVAQYIYFQSTPLAYNYHYESVPDPTYGKFGLMTIITTTTRDWTIGLVGLLIGLVLLSLGIFWLARQKRQGIKA